MTRRELSDARAVVTGASSGIGRELVRQLASCGTHLVINARRLDRLQELVDELERLSVRIIPVAGDITSASVRQQLIATACDELGGLDILINNAGIGAIGPFATASAERLQRVMNVNFIAAAELIRAGLELLENGNRPIIVNVSSVLGHRAVPWKSEYCASKFALHGFSDALRAELAPRGIDVLLVSPSTTRTEFFANVIEGQIEHSRHAPGGTPAHRVAKATLRAIKLGRHEVILTAGGKALVWLDRICPPLANRLVARFTPGTAELGPDKAPSASADSSCAKPRGLSDREDPSK